MNRERLFLGVLAACFALVLGAEVLLPDPVDWSDSFEAGDARPYGSDVLRSLVADLFPEAAVATVDAPPYLHLRDATATGGAYLFVADRFAPDPVETERLLAYARRGNSVFVAAHRFGGAWADSLNLATERTTYRFAAPPAEQDTVHVGLAGTQQRYPLREAAGQWVVSRVDTARTEMLGTVVENGSNDPPAPNFVRTSVGAGTVYVNTSPRAFTNVHLLSDASAPYVYGALSYLPATASPVWWDAYHKPGRVQSGTPLRYVVSHPTLGTAFTLALVGALLFIVFQGRRRQRPIPVHTPPTNATVDFVKTVGRLYHRQGDHADLARKRIQYLRATLRERLGLSAGPVDEHWVRIVSQRSGVDRGTVETLAEAMHTARRASSLSAADLRALDDAIHAFEQARLR